MRHEYHSKCNFLQMSTEIRGDPSQVTRARDIFLRWHQSRLKIHDRHEEQRRQQAQLPKTHDIGGQYKPTQNRGQNPGGGHQAAAQVVDHLHPAQPVDTVLEVHDEWQQLPVAPHPAVLTRGVDIVTDREILDHLHICGQCGARQSPLQQVVAEHGVFGKVIRHRGLEGGDIVDALAGKGPTVEQILVEVGHGKDIWIHPATG